MEEVIPTTVTKNVFTVALTAVVDFYYPLRWFLLAALILIIADLRFGILAARKRGEKIRISKAGRRSFNKAMDYLCWISIADVLGVTFGSHFITVGSIVMLIAGSWSLSVGANISIVIIFLPKSCSLLLGSSFFFCWLLIFISFLS